MSLSGIILGLINICIVVVILVLIGVIAEWILNMLGWPIPEQVRKLYLAIVALIALYMIVALLFNIPTVHIIRGNTSSSVPQLAATPSIIAPER